MAARALTWFKGQWLDGNPQIVGPLTQGFWLSSIVFDGARAFEGVTPDLNRHCVRVGNSAQLLGLRPLLSAGEIEELAHDGIRRLATDNALYIRPMYWAEDGFVAPDPDSTEFALTLVEMPMPPASGFTAAWSSRRRPLPGTAPTEAKASCLYPNAGLALQEVRRRGFDNAILLDPLGHVAEFATANLFMVKDGVVHTPIPNDTFLNGITRQRVIALLRTEGLSVIERCIAWPELAVADEIFSTGNYGKLMPLVRLEDKALEVGPVFRCARKLYWDFAHSRCA